MEVQEAQVVEEFIVPLSPKANDEEPQISETSGPITTTHSNSHNPVEQPPRDKPLVFDGPITTIHSYSYNPSETPRDKPLLFDGRIIWRKTEEIDSPDVEWDQEVEITTTENYCEIEQCPQEQMQNTTETCEIKTAASYDFLKDMPIVEIYSDSYLIAEEIVETEIVVDERDRSKILLNRGYSDHEYDHGSEDEFVEADDHSVMGDRALGLITCFCCRRRYRSFNEIRNHAKELSEQRFNGNNIPVWRKHICCLCGYTTDRLWSLKTHVVSMHEGKKEYTCPHCAYNTSIFSALRGHIQTHTEERPYACKECDYRAVTSGSLKSHTNLRHKNRLHQCQKCEYIAISSNLLKSHVNSHHKGTEKVYECGLCDFRAKQYASWKNHILSVHAKVKPFKCSECPYQTNKADLLNAHINRKHNKEKVPLSCPHCSYTVSRPSNLETHIKSKHSVPEYDCVYCDYKTFKPDNLRRHIENKHLPEDIPECPFCGLRAASGGAMKRHIKTFHVKKTYFVCSYCTFSASLASDLEHHVRTYHQAEKKPNRCHQCMFSSDTAAELSDHVVSIHLKPCRGQCPFCEYKDLDNEILAEHIRSTHAKQKTYRCPHCDFGCSNHDIMKNHARSAHNMGIKSYVQ